MTAALNDAIAQVTGVRSYSQDEVAELMLRRGSLLTKADILAVLEVYGEVILDLVSDGSAVHTPLFQLMPSIMGVFDGPGDSFDPARHKIKINLNQGVAVRDAALKIKTQKVQVAEPIPYIQEVKDVISGVVNDQLTPGGVMQLTGSRLKVIEDEPSNGIFLITAGTTDEIKLGSIIDNKPSRLLIMLPQSLDPGDYWLEVRTTFTHGKTGQGKQLKIGRFHKWLRVP